jgi:hypothetical protein
LNPLFQLSNIPLFCAAAGATGGGAGTTGRTGCTLELSAYGKGKGGHHPIHFFAFAFRASNFFGRVEDQLFKFVLALMAVIFKNWHLRISFIFHPNIF